MSTDENRATFALLIKSILDTAVQDIVQFSKVCNYKTLKSHVRQSGRANDNTIASLDRFHVDHIRGAYEFLLDGQTVYRSSEEEGLIEYSLSDLFQWANLEITNKALTKRILSMIHEQVGHIPSPICHIVFDHDGTKGDKMGASKNQEEVKELTNRLVQMTSTSSIEWNLQEDNELGCAPYMVEKKDYKHIGTFSSQLEKHKSRSLHLELSCYNKTKLDKNNNKKKYAEYVLAIFEFNEKGEKAQLEQKGMGKLWKAIGGDFVEYKTKLSVSSINSFLAAYDA